MTEEVDSKTWVVNDFLMMRNQQDLLNLLNKVYRQIWEGWSTGHDFRPISMKTLNYYKNVKKSGTHRYKTFTIKKKSGKLRVINAPVKGLKLIQKCLNEIFQSFYEKNTNAFGFIPGRNIADGARAHVGKSYILNLDLKDFFDSIDYYRVKAMLEASPFKLMDDKDNPQSLSFTIANLCCNPKEVKRYNNKNEETRIMRSVIPQGAPTSPILTNLICRNLDRRLNGLAKRFHACYTRYADDITFSSDVNIFESNSVFTTELKRIIEQDQKFRINESKTRIQSNKFRQEVTGLVVNEKLNVSKRYIKQIRMWLYYWECYGYDKAAALFLHDYVSDKGHVKSKLAKLENVLSGKLDYLKMIVGNDNPAYLKLSKRFEVLTNITDNPDCTVIELDSNVNQTMSVDSESCSVIDLLKTLVDIL